MKDVKYWIIVASKDHIQIGKEGGFIQVGHGKRPPLARMSKGDYVICYSAKAHFEKSEKCQEFTAIGTIKDDDIYQHRTTESFSPYRRNVTFLPSKDVSIVPLIEQLSFIQNKAKWGYPFRFGYFQINKNDFELIQANML